LWTSLSSSTEEGFEDVSKTKALCSTPVVRSTRVIIRENLVCVSDELESLSRRWVRVDIWVELAS
jgi:hypothetical protein